MGGFDASALERERSTICTGPGALIGRRVPDHDGNLLELGVSTLVNVRGSLLSIVAFVSLNHYHY